jgi:hypothetical protein
VDLAGPDLAREMEGAVDVLRPDGGRDVVVEAVREAHGLSLVAERDDRQDRPEDLLVGVARDWSVTSKIVGSSQPSSSPMGGLRR